MRILALPPVVCRRDLPQTRHLTSVVEHPKMICSLPQSRHLTFRKRERGSGMVALNRGLVISIHNPVLLHLIQFKLAEAHGSPVFNHPTFLALQDWERLLVNLSILVENFLGLTSVPRLLPVVPAPAGCGLFTFFLFLIDRNRVLGVFLALSTVGRSFLGDAHVRTPV